MEFMLSFFYVLMYYAFVIDKRSDPDIFGIGIGGVILIGSVAFGPYTRACVNILRYIGPAVIMWEFNDFYIYFLANLFGGLFGGFYYKSFIWKEDDNFLNEEGEKSYAKYCEKYAQLFAKANPNAKRHYYQTTAEPNYGWGFKGTPKDLVKIHEITYKAVHGVDPTTSPTATRPR